MAHPYHERNLRHKPSTEPSAMRQAFTTAHSLAPGQDAAQLHVLPSRIGNFMMDNNAVRQSYAAQYINHTVPRLLDAPITRQAIEQKPQQSTIALQSTAQPSSIASAQGSRSKVDTNTIADALKNNVSDNLFRQSSDTFSIIARDQDPFTASSEINRSIGVPHGSFANLLQPRSAPVNAVSGIRPSLPVPGFVPQTFGNQTILRYAPYDMPQAPDVNHREPHPRSTSSTSSMQAHTQPLKESRWAFAPDPPVSDSFMRSEPSTSMTGLGASHIAPQQLLSLSRHDPFLTSTATTASSNIAYSGQGYLSDSLGSSSTLCTPMSEDPYLMATSPGAHQVGAPIWKQLQTSQSFKLYTLEGKDSDEPFKNAFQALKDMNPNVYQLPHGSCVVAVKCSNVANIVKSIEHGIWACPTNVSQRIAKVCADRAPSEKVLLLFSVSGSKQFCGFAEVVNYMPDFPTDFWVSDDPKIRGRVAHESAFTIDWVYCKLVAFDTVRIVDKRHQGESVTQMWNGMHYKDDVGRDVIKAYVEAPHVENLLMRKTKSSEGSAKRSTGRQSAPSTQSRRPYSNPSHELIFHRDDVTASGRIMTNSEIREQSAQSARFNRLRPERDGSFAPPPVFGTPAAKLPTPKPSTPQHVTPLYGSPSPPRECSALEFSLDPGVNVKDMVLTYCILRPDGTYRIANVADVQMRQPNAAIGAGPLGSFGAPIEAGNHVLRPVFQDKDLATRLNLSETTAAWALVQEAPAAAFQTTSERARNSTECISVDVSTPSRGSSATRQNPIESQVIVDGFDGAAPAPAARPFYRYSSAYLKALSFTAPFKLTEDDYINAEIAQAIITDALEESMAAPLSSNSMAYVSPTYAGHSMVSPTPRTSHVHDWRGAGQWVDGMARTHESAGEDGGIMLWPRNPSLGER